MFSLSTLVLHSSPVEGIQRVLADGGQQPIEDLEEGGREGRRERGRREGGGGRGREGGGSHPDMPWYRL